MRDPDRRGGRGAGEWVSLEALAHTCTPIVKPGPLDEKRAEAFLDLPAHEIYPMRIS